MAGQGIFVAVRYMTGFLVLAASTDVKMLPGKCSFGLVSRTSVHLCCAALYCFCCCFNFILFLNFT